MMELATRAEAKPPLIRPKKLAHIVLRTPSVDAMRDWYAAVLGASVAHEAPASPKLCFLTFDEEHHRIALVEEPGIALAKEGVRASLDHIAFTYGDLGDLLHTYERLAEKGIEPFLPIHHGPTISLYYRDPDGNRIELQVDTMSADEAQDFIRSPDFTTNPIGVIFDPADLAARFRDGEKLADLLRRPSLPPGVHPYEMLRD